MATLIDIANWDDCTRKARDALAAGRCVALPTETVYGLAADATNGLAVARVFEMKGRPRFNPLIAHVADIEMARAHGAFDKVAELLAASFWPGPLTIVTRKRADSAIHDLVTAGLDTVALRMPKGIAHDVITAFGRPLAAPSANRSGRVSPTTAAHVAEEFADTDLLILDGGPCEVGIESTIVRVDDGRLTVLRPGLVTAEALAEVSGTAVSAAAAGSPVQAPGMLASHYAPRARLLLDAGTCPNGAALLAFGNGAAHRNAGPMLNLSPAADLREAAANLYHHIKELDATGAEIICVEPIPATGIGVAINDRLGRAAAPRS